jgi:hypothetical protein
MCLAAKAFSIKEPEEGDAHPARNGHPLRRIDNLARYALTKNRSKIAEQKSTEIRK